MKHFVDTQGNYVGIFYGHEPEGGIELPTGPAHGFDKWDFETETWVPYVEPVILSPLDPTEFGNALIDELGETAVDQVDAAIEAMPNGPEKAKARWAWQRAGSFERNHPFVVSISAALGITPERMDALWQGALDAR